MMMMMKTRAIKLVMEAKNDHFPKFKKIHLSYPCLSRDDACTTGLVHRYIKRKWDRDWYALIFQSAEEQVGEF